MGKQFHNGEVEIVLSTCRVGKPEGGYSIGYLLAEVSAL
jgi:hypothetical protein